jgi:hypothetical protein
MADNDDEGLFGGAGMEELLEEMRAAQLGDERRNARLLEVVSQLAASPASSFAKACETEAQLEGMYRFFRNPHVGWEAILAPHIDKTVERAHRAPRVLAVHDTSAIRVPDDADFESYIQTGKRGFFAHASMLVDEERCPLGIAALEVLKRPKKQRRTRKNGRGLSGGETRRLKDREFLRWSRAVEQVEERLDGANVVHVMDRECDSYELLHRLHEANKSFVIRWCKDRNARLPQEEAGWSKARELLEQASPLSVSREVSLGRRRAKTAPGARKASPPRRQRKARLRVSSCALELKKPAYLPTSEGFAHTLTVNVVRVYEPEPPEGEVAVEWVLLTSLPIEQPSDVEAIVDIYRARWLIEEFFKALKTGCGYRTRRLTNPQSILNSFATLVPIAVKALALRNAAEQRPDGKAPRLRSPILEPDELAVLKAKARKMGRPLPNDPSDSDVLALVARFGGHRKSSGPPGWSTLMRGLEKLQSLAEGWALAHGAEM